MSLDKPIYFLWRCLRGIELMAGMVVAPGRQMSRRIHIQERFGEVGIYRRIILIFHRTCLAFGSTT